jgi:Fe-S cluster biogenesis protein NfuA
MDDDGGAVRAFLEGRLRRMIQADGGDVVVDRVEDGRVTVRLRGECSRCPAAPRHLVGWLAERLEEEFGRPFTVEPVFDRPYFYR